MSKRALLRRLDGPNSDKFYFDMGKRILDKVNASGLGPQGFGGDTTALGCMIETGPCHIASLPVAVNIETGLTNLEYNEVLAGLQEGDSVIVLPSTGLLESQARGREMMRRFSVVPGGKSAQKGQKAQGSGGATR